MPVVPACLVCIAMKMIHDRCCALDVVSAAVAILEDSPFTNAGIGSNLNLCGNVECDASIMDGRSLQYGAVGALSGVQNPIKVCRALIQEQMKGPLSCGRIPPCVLVGNGALQWARNYGIQETTTSSLLTKSTLSAYRKHKRRLSAVDQNSSKKRDTSDNHIQPPCLVVDSLPSDGVSCIDSLLDTVGAVCVDASGNVSSAVSSGGIALKHPGRVGQASMYGCGCWAQNGTKDDRPSVACSTSGCGEHLMKTLLAKECCRSVLGSGDCSAMAVQRTFREGFIESPFLASVDEKLGGALVLSHHHDEGVELVWAHTTETMCLGYMSSVSSTPKFQLSSLPASATSGKSLQVQGVNFKQPP
ncbi:threonine aspartase 1-like isoform X2 [Acanthaster planci]|uniref:Threonine aspartase 1-like isoform X2 n=1 Tax=Acanthaster planci TaxID=133434 RepID=A0A8B7YDC4_ACAPL|nr:threonine aspartase 1-like isoform X2 [Acanthaster planci]